MLGVFIVLVRNASAWDCNNDGKEVGSYFLFGSGVVLVVLLLMTIFLIDLAGVLTTPIHYITAVQYCRLIFIISSKKSQWRDDFFRKINKIFRPLSIFVDESDNFIENSVDELILACFLLVVFCIGIKYTKSIRSFKDVLPFLYIVTVQDLLYYSLLNINSFLSGSFSGLKAIEIVGIIFSVIYFMAFASFFIFFIKKFDKESRFLSIFTEEFSINILYFVVFTGNIGFNTIFFVFIKVLPILAYSLIIANEFLMSNTYIVTYVLYFKPFAKLKLVLILMYHAIKLILGVNLIIFESDSMTEYSLQKVLIIFLALCLFLTFIRACIKGPIIQIVEKKTIKYEISDEIPSESKEKKITLEKHITSVLDETVAEKKIDVSEISVDFSLKDNSHLSYRSKNIFRPNRKIYTKDDKNVCVSKDENLDVANIDFEIPYSFHNKKMFEAKYNTTRNTEDSSKNNK